MIDKILILLIVLVNMAGRVIGDYYFITDAVCWVLAAMFFINNSKRTTKIIAEWALILTINNLIDELFFNPCIFGWNEGVIFVAASIRAYMQYMKQNGRHKG